jgi:hypothetical protein
MDPLRELIATNQRRALEFFFLALRDLCDATVDQQELLYNASILAHFAQVSTRATEDLPTPADLGAVFDLFVLDTTVRHDGALMEAAAGQCLLLTGFFEDQMRQRYNVRWYAELGAEFFRRAARCEPTARKVHLLHTLARRFESWRQIHARLSRELRDQAYLIASPGPRGSSRAA